MSDAYSKAGVDISAGSRATSLMREAVRATYGAEVLSDTGAFGGLFSAVALKSMDEPILVASTDGVGTKTMVASKMGCWDTIGQDLVNHCVNDILVQGAKPLFFLDYVASSKLDPEQIASIVSGCAKACKAVGAALLGGETAEMPGVYQDDEIDVAGTIVGVLDKKRLIDGSRIQAGEVILSLPSTGLHTNGFSLARKVLENHDWLQPDDTLYGQSIGEALLAVHRCYLTDVEKLRQFQVDVHGLAHITGGGVIDNLPRILPEGLGAFIHKGTWEIPPIFSLIQSVGDISDDDMYHTFNMGLGMLVVVSAEQSARIVKSALLPDVAIVGEIVADHTGVKLL